MDTRKNCRLVVEKFLLLVFFLFFFFFNLPPFWPYSLKRKGTLFWPLADCKVFCAIGYGEHTRTFYSMYIILVWNDNFIPIVCYRLKSSLCLRYCLLCLCFFYYCLVKLQKGNEIILYRQNIAYLQLLGSVFFTETKSRGLTDLKKGALIYPGLFTKEEMWKKYMSFYLKRRWKNR